MSTHNEEIAGNDKVCSLLIRRIINKMEKAEKGHIIKVTTAEADFERDIHNLCESRGWELLDFKEVDKLSVFRIQKI